MLSFHGDMEDNDNDEELPSGIDQLETLMEEYETQSQTQANGVWPATEGWQESCGRIQ